MIKLATSSRFTELFLPLIGLLTILMMVGYFELGTSISFLGADDAYIHLRYIDNLQRTRVFGFNPGTPSNGSTSPLWVFLAAAVTHRAADLLGAIKLFSTTLFLLSIIVYYALVYRLAGGHFLSFLATVVYASDPWMLKWAGSAMEASLVSLLVLSSVFFFIQSFSFKHVVLGSLLLGVSTLARPEFFLLFLLFLVLTVTSGESAGHRLIRLAAMLACYTIVLVPWLVFSLTTFGSPLPNTFTAKIVESQASMWSVAWFFIRVFGVTYWPWLIGFGGLFLFRAKEKENSPSHINPQKRAMLFLFLWCTLVPLFYILGKLQTPSTRYLQLVSPVLVFISSIGLAMKINAKTSHRQPLLIALTFIIVGWNVGLNSSVVFPSSQDFTEGVLQTYGEVGEWLRQNTPEKSRVAVWTDVGVIGYYSNREIMDLGGLNTPEVIPFAADNLAYVFVSRPDYLVVTGEEQEFGLLKETRFKTLAEPVLSLPARVGLRAELMSQGGSPHAQEIHVSVYRLRWDE